MNSRRTCATTVGITERAGIFEISARFSFQYLVAVACRMMVVGPRSGTLRLSYGG